MPDNRADSPVIGIDSPAVAAHINLLQGIINRLANNSSSCKTWCLALVGALLSLAGATHVPAIVTFALIPVVIFGVLDGMYLAQERAYRRLYGGIVGLIRAGDYRRADAYEAGAPIGLADLLSSLASWSIFPIYGSLIVAYIIADVRGWLAVLAVAGK